MSQATFKRFIKSLGPNRVGAVIINGISAHPDFQGSMHGLDPCRMVFEPKDNREPSHESSAFGNRSCWDSQGWFSDSDRRLDLKIHEDSEETSGIARQGSGSISIHRQRYHRQSRPNFTLEQSGGNKRPKPNIQGHRSLHLELPTASEKSNSPSFAS